MLVGRRICETKNILGDACNIVEHGNKIILSYWIKKEPELFHGFIKEFDKIAKTFLTEVELIVFSLLYLQYQKKLWVAPKDFWTFVIIVVRS